MGTTQAINPEVFREYDDCRLSSERYQATIMLGLSNGGISVIDIGLCVTPSQAGM
jgi:phosphomannomutase